MRTETQEAPASQASTESSPRPRTIWKFPLTVTDRQKVVMPKGAQILHVASQYEIPCLWALVDEYAEKEERLFAIFPTGNVRFDAANAKHVGSFILSGGAFVGHIFEPIHSASDSPPAPSGS